MIPGFDGALCVRRNKLAALIGNHTTEGAPMEATPVRFFSSASASKVANAWLTAGESIDRFGALPVDDDAALKLINALLPEGEQALTNADVYIRYCEAASGVLIPDRYGFLDSTTLMNIAKNAASGVSFMNSHRTGDFSSPSELPFGKTFTGQYEQSLTPVGKIAERSLVGFYMQRDLKPNGANGPTTDDLNRMIGGGTLKDVSVGLNPGVHGKTICNVCEQPLNKCSHYPGTNRNMELADQERARDVHGVPTGVASYKLVNWQMGELSGVYDGAIPGAGFSKGYQLFAAGDFKGEHAEQFARAYSALI